MRERSEQGLRIACMVMGAFLVYQVATLVARKNPLDHLSIPALPSLPVEPVAQAAGKKTNSPAQTDLGRKGTNAGPQTEAANKTTNTVAAEAAAKQETKSRPVQDL